MDEKSDEYIERECRILDLCRKGPRRLAQKVIELEDARRKDHEELTKALLRGAELEVELCEKDRRIKELEDARRKDHEELTEALYTAQGARVNSMQRIIRIKELEAEVLILKRLLNARRYDANTLHAKLDRIHGGERNVLLRELIDSWPFMEVKDA